MFRDLLLVRWNQIASMQECKKGLHEPRRMLDMAFAPLRAAIHLRPVRKGNKKSQLELIGKR